MLSPAGRLLPPLGGSLSSIGGIGGRGGSGGRGGDRGGGGDLGGGGDRVGGGGRGSLYSLCCLCIAHTQTRKQRTVKMMTGGRISFNAWGLLGPSCSPADSNADLESVVAAWAAVSVTTFVEGCTLSGGQSLVGIGSPQGSRVQCIEHVSKFAPYHVCAQICWTQGSIWRRCRTLAGLAGVGDDEGGIFCSIEVIVCEEGTISLDDGIAMTVDMMESRILDQQSFLQ